MTHGPGVAARRPLVHGEGRVGEAGGAPRGGGMLGQRTALCCSSASAPDEG